MKEITEIIVPYKNRNENEIAVVNRDTSMLLDESRGWGPQACRVTDLYIGRYGNLGYVRLNSLGHRSHDFKKVEGDDSHGEPIYINSSPVRTMLTGELDIPASLLNFLLRENDDIFFKFFELSNCREWSFSSSLSEAKIFDKKYMYTLTDYCDIHENLKISKIIREYEDNVIKTIIDFEKSIDEFLNLEQIPTFEKLKSVGLKEVLNDLKFKVSV